MAPPDASFDRGQRKLERPRRDQRILVEHFVEVAHPEEDDGAGILALRRHWRIAGVGDALARAPVDTPVSGGDAIRVFRRVKTGPARGRVPAGAIGAGVGEV